MSLADKLRALALDSSTTEEERRTAAMQYIKLLGPSRFEVVNVAWSAADGGGRTVLQTTLNKRSAEGWTLAHFSDAIAAWTCVFERKDPQ